MYRLRQRHSILCMPLLVLCALFLGLSCSVAAAQGTKNPLTPREVFAQLPESIFENTIEGLSESQKMELLRQGRSDFWEIAAETDDVLVLAALPFRETAVALRLFRHSTDGSIKAAIGTLGGPICTLELWQVDSNGRIVPADTPQEPEISDFLDGEKLPEGVNATVMLCLGMGGLKAQPVFWTATGMTDVPLRRAVSYQWDGKHFEKCISRKDEPAPSPESIPIVSEKTAAREETAPALPQDTTAKSTRPEVVQPFHTGTAAPAAAQDTDKAAEQPAAGKNTQVKVKLSPAPAAATTVKPAGAATAGSAGKSTSAAGQAEPRSPQNSPQNSPPAPIVPTTPTVPTAPTVPHTTPAPATGAETGH